MAKLLIFVLLAVLCGALHVAAEEAKPKVEEVKKDQKPLPAKADKIDLGPQKDPLFEQLLGGIATLAANLIGGTAAFLHGAIMVVTNTGHALIKGVGKVADTLVLGAINLATGVGKGNPTLKGDLAKGWQHPVMLKEIGYCHSVTRDMCNKMSQKERGKNAPTVTAKSSHLAPKGCYLKKKTKNGKPYQYFVWNKPEYKTEKECSEKNICVCEVCARMTTEGKCCNLPFAYDGKLNNDCIGVGGILGLFGKSYKCGVTDIVTDGKDLQTCISQDHQKKIDAANINNPIEDCNGAMTTSGQCCKFPFTFNGHTETQCIKTGCGWFGWGCSAPRCGVTDIVTDINQLQDCATAKKDAKQSDAPRISNVQDAQDTKERFLDAFVHKVEEKLEEKFKDMVTKAVQDEEEEDHEDYKPE